MFVSEKLVYTELHKTGGTHIGRLLAELLVGEQQGKHNRIPKELWNRFIIGSIRNPWEWYVSLWAYGCGKKGSVYSYTTRKFNFHYYNSQLHPEMGLKRTNIKFSGIQFGHDILKPVCSWRSVYQDYRDADAFKKWLRLLFDPKRRFDVGEGYGFSPVSHSFGLMTYRLLKIYSKLGGELYYNSSLNTLKGVKNSWENRSLVSYMIRNESLESDLLSAMKQAGCLVTDKQKGNIVAASEQKSNTSKRFSANYYYDPSSIELVRKRERLIVDCFSYEPPTTKVEGDY